MNNSRKANPMDLTDRITQNLLKQLAAVDLPAREAMEIATEDGQAPLAVMVRTRKAPDAFKAGEVAIALPMLRAGDDGDVPAFAVYSFKAQRFLQVPAEKIRVL